VTPGIQGYAGKRHHGAELVTLFREYENIDELNRRVLMALVDKIVIHESHEIEIIYKYRDEYKHAKEYADGFDEERSAAM
jgi:hypothetical protein